MKCRQNTSCQRTLKPRPRLERSSISVLAEPGAAPRSRSTKRIARTWNTAATRIKGASPAHSVASYYQVGGHLLSTSERSALENPTLALFIPCKIDLSSKRERMLYIAAILPDGYLDSRYVCPDCGAIRVRHKAMMCHMGMTPNVPASCPIYQK